MKDIYFTIVKYIDEEEDIERKLKKLLAKTDVKVIAADAICSLDTMNACEHLKKKYENRFEYLKVKDMDLAKAYNTAMEYIEGRYVNFSLLSVEFEDSAIEAVWDIAEDNDRPKLISLCPWTVNEKGETVQYRMSPNKTASCEEINLNDTPEKLQLFFHGYFIRCSLMKSKERHMWFRSELSGDAVSEVLLSLLAEIKKYTYIGSLKVFYSHQLEDNTSAFMGQHFKWWYTDSLKLWLLPFAQKLEKEDWPIRKPIRIALLYYCFVRFNCNYNDRNKMVLNEDETKEFYMLAGKILQYVDNNIIWNKTSLQNFNIPRTMKILLLKLKAEACMGTLETVLHDKDIYLYTKKNGNENMGTVSQSFKISREKSKLATIGWAYDNGELLRVGNLSSEHVIISIINYTDGKLEIDGTLSVGDFLEDKQIVSLKVVKGKRSYDAVRTEAYGLRKLFGRTYEHVWQFHVSVPVYSMEKNVKMHFVMNIGGEDIIIQIRTSMVYAHINPTVPKQYWHFGKDWCLNIEKKNTLVLSKVTAGDIKKKEAAFQTELLARSKSGNKAAEFCLELRKEYFARKEEFENRRIWITFDKLYKAGDNGEYIYNYVSKQNDGIEIFYLIKEDSPDYTRMKESGANLLLFGSQETLIYALYAEAILTTHANVFSYIGFEKIWLPYISDIFNPVNICIQHGLTVQNIAEYQYRWFDNLKLYLCASPNEVSNLRRPIYDYQENQIQLTGLARYDGLKSKNRKQILITPSWRRNIANANIAHFKKGHNDYFKQSDYYNIYARLIDDTKLINCAKKYGYELIYLLHPAASSQLEDFKDNGFVKIIPAASDMNYETILTESSLMVTDFSGVQFDFAYMRKVILYYHPKEIPPHYTESPYYHYDTDAFGPIIDNHDELVECLCEYMKNDCKTKTEYINRADSFFAFNDSDNCKRIYEAALKFLNEKEWRKYGAGRNAK